MYIRTTRRRNKDGSVTEYLQLAHNEWDKAARRSAVNVLINLGRKEDVDPQGLERLAASIRRYLGTHPGNTPGITANDVKVLSSKTYGGCWLLDQLWQRMGIGECLKRLLLGKGYEIPIERALFAMAANRAINPASKLANEAWVNEEAYIPNLPAVCVHQLYRSMDFLLEHDAAVQENVFFGVANLLNLEVDLIYFDTTSTYFEIDNPDETEEADEDGAGALRQHGHTKDHRPDLPQIVIGMAVTKEGIPVRCWVFSGETADMSIVEQVKKDLKYLIKTSDDTLSLSDIVLGYKQLHDIERGFRTLKSDLDLRPVYHHKPSRIRAHVLICWLALLLIRIAENETAMTWFSIRKMLKPINLVSLKLPEGVVQQSTELTQAQESIFKACKTKAPPKVIQMQPL